MALGTAFAVTGGLKLLGGFLNRRKAKKHAAAMQAAFERERLRARIDQYRSVGYEVPMGASQEQMDGILNSQGPRTWLPGYGAQDERQMFGNVVDDYGAARDLNEEYRPQQEQQTDYISSLAGPQRVQELRDMEGDVQGAMTEGMEGNIAARNEGLTGQIQQMNRQASDQNLQNMQARYGGQNVGGAGFMNRMQGTRQNLFGGVANARAEAATQAAEDRGNMGVNLAQRNQNFEQNVVPQNQMNAYGNIFADRANREGNMFSAFDAAKGQLNMFAPNAANRTPVQQEKVFQKPFMGSSAGNLMSGLGDMGMSLLGPAMGDFGKGFSKGMGAKQMGKDFGGMFS